ncbi:hypothetical protein ACDI16_02410 [Oceanobacillus caeni]
MKKRKQYMIMHYKFNKLVDKGDYLEFVEDSKVEYTSSENILFNTVCRISKDHEVNEKETKINSIFVLNASQVNKDNESDLRLYERIMRKGVFINGIKFVRFGKSSSMTMNQRTLFVKETLHDKLKEYISLDKIPNKTVISKYETALGLTLSSLVLVKGLPKIAIVPDFERTVIEDVKTVDKFIPSEKDMQTDEYKEHIKNEQLEKEYQEKGKQVIELFTSTYLKKNFTLSTNQSHRSKSAWNREMLQVKVDELDKPVGYKQYEDNVYAVYSKNQTEKELVTINKYNLGYEVNVRKNYENTIEPFDGMALVSFEYANKLDKGLKLKHKANGYQIRMPYVKGLAIRFNVKDWFEEHNVTEIKDIWGNTIPVDGLDLILTESCFKAKQEASSDKSNRLFESIDEYIELLKKYGHNYIGITDAIKPVDKSDIYTPLTYQFLNSLNLSVENLRELADKPVQMYAKIMKYGDVASVKAFLNMIVKEDDESRLDVDVKKAIDLNSAMIFDPRCKEFIIKQIKQKIRDLAVGKIPVQGNYKYVSGDTIALMQHMSGKEVKGFLRYDEQYCNGITGEHVMMRNPLTSWHEVHKTNFVKSDIEYVQHLNNVIQINSYDLTMPKNSGMDVDGDKVLLTNEPIIKNAVIDDLVIVNKDDKTTTNAQPYEMESIVKFELRNLDNMTGVITNINTMLQSYALEKGDLRYKELEIATCKQLQAEFIDSIKKGTNPIIPKVLLKYKRFKPYFQRYVYGNYDVKKYRAVKSPLNLFCYFKVEKWMKSVDQGRYVNSEQNDLHSVDAFSLIRDMSKVNFRESVILKLVKQIEPIYDWYAKEKQAIWREEKEINKRRPTEDEKEQLMEIKHKWQELYEKTRNKLQVICDNPSVLTSACITLGYDKKSYVFGWIATKDAEGILENIRASEEMYKTDVKAIPQLDRLNRTYGGLVMVVKDGLGHFVSLGDTFRVSLEDGKYPVVEQMGYHFVEVENKRNSNIEVSDSASLDVEVTLKPLRDYNATLVNIKDTDIDDKTIYLKKDGKYLNVLLDNRLVAGISKDSRYDFKNEIGLDDYVDKPIKIKVKKVNKNSINVTLNV